MNKKEEKKNLIIEYIFEEECIYICKIGLYHCETCSHFEECYAKAKIEDIKNRHFDDSFDDFAEVINYGGYKTADEFWNELLE